MIEGQKGLNWRTELPGLLFNDRQWSIFQAYGMYDNFTQQNRTFWPKSLRRSLGDEFPSDAGQRLTGDCHGSE